MEFFTTPDLLIAYALLQSALFLFLIRFLDLYEREPLTVIAAMAIWGGIGAGALALLGNQSRAWAPPWRRGHGLRRVGVRAAGRVPAKGIALIIAFAVSHLLNRRYGFLEFEGVTDGIVYGAAVGIGFAFTEDVYYLTNELLVGGATALKEGEEIFLLRRDFLGLGSLGHAVYTGVFGAALGLATWITNRALKVVVSIAGLLLAILLHSGPQRAGRDLACHPLRLGQDRCSALWRNSSLVAEVVEDRERLHERVSRSVLSSISRWYSRSSA